MKYVTTHRSPHFNSRPKGAAIRLICLHADAGASDKGTLSWLAAEESKVSYHILVGRDGTAYEVVDPRKRAWHAGKSVWKGASNCNDYSVGVAFANRHDGTEPLTDAQLATMLDVVRDLAGRFPIADVVTHAMIAPSRKTDPNDSPRFALQPYADAAMAARLAAIREARDV